VTTFWLIKCAGAFNLGLGIFHLYFHKLFMWDRTLPRMDMYNRGVLLALHWMMILVFGMVGLALLSGVGGPETMRVLLAGGAIFWAVRAVLQPILWPFEGRMAYGLFAVFIFGALLHGVPCLMN